MEATLFQQCKSLDRLVNAYIKAVRALNISYKQGKSEVRKRLDEDFYRTLKEKFNIDDIDDDYVEYGLIVDKFMDIDVLLVKYGKFLWATGNTFPYREQLKEIGFKYSPKRKSWFMDPIKAGF